MSSDRTGQLPMPPSSRPSDASPELDLAGALHEVSNALTVVSGLLERLQSSELLDPQLRAYVEVAHARACDGRLIARRAIGAASPEGAHERPVSELVSEALVGVQPEADRKRLSLTTTGDGSLDGVSVDDARKVLQVLTNLLLNAIAFSPEGGTIRLTVDPDVDSVCITVHDEGPGVPDDKRDRLFKRGSSTRDGGAGIGLAHARQLALKAGGELSLEPSSRGARFVLRWPRAAAWSARTPRTAPRQSLDGHRILVIEDDPAVVVLLETALAARGADVVTCSDRDALDRALTDSPYQAVLVDLSPLRDGVSQAMSRIRAHSGHARIVVISGSAAPDDDALDHAAAWVRKPFEVGEVIAALVQRKSAPVAVP